MLRCLLALALAVALLTTQAAAGAMEASMQWLDATPGTKNTQMVIHIPALPQFVSSGDEFQFPLPEGTKLVTPSVECSWQLTGFKRRAATNLILSDAKKAGLRVSYFRPVAPRDYNEGDELILLCGGFDMSAAPFASSTQRFFLQSPAFALMGEVRVRGTDERDAALHEKATMAASDGC